jgi:hypothetical protein
VALRAVYSNTALAACWRMVSSGYGHSSLLLVPCGDEVSEADAFIESSNGVHRRLLCICSRIPDEYVNQ